MTGATITFPLLGDWFSISPSESFSVFGLTFHWYGAIIAVGFLLAALYCMRRADSFGLTPDHVVDMLIFAVPIAVVGARAYYVIFNFADYKDNLIDVFKVWEGGLAIYGGIIGGLLGVYVYSKVKKIPMAPVLDVAGLGLLIGQAIGRWGNFINREAFGSETDVPWKMGLTNKYGTFYYHPTFLYESLWNVLGLVLLHFYSKKKRRYDGEIFVMYVGWYGLGRLVIEGLRTDSLYLFSTNIRVSQLLAGLSLLAALFILFWNRFMRHPDPELMYVNRKQEPQAAETSEAAEEVGALEKDGDSEDEDFGGQFGEGGEVLGGHAEEDDGAEIPDEPVIEPIDVKLYDADDSKPDADNKKN